MIYKKYIKRIIDLVISILAFLPTIIVISIFGTIIYIFDRGPIFYFADRIGYNGKQFKMIKLRTMILNAPDIRLEDGSTFNGINDNRVTKIGKFLRKNSIDEIPQFLNVLVGNMSIVGIRPDPIDWLKKYNENEKIILTVKPGITGYNQAYFRNYADGMTKLKNDIFYAQNVSFKLDFKIFLKTIITVIKRKNINHN